MRSTPNGVTLTPSVLVFKPLPLVSIPQLAFQLQLIDCVESHEEEFRILKVQSNAIQELKVEKDVLTPLQISDSFKGGRDS
jgi:hypothetical protein